MQKANRLYNKHLSEKIKYHIINISNDYNSMKTWLIITYGGPSRIVGDIIGNLSRKSKPSGGIERRNLRSTPPSPELYKGWRDYLESTT